jgi:hypothetical protein
MKKLLVFIATLVVSTPALAWNEKGHLVSARLAWRQLTENQRAQVSAALKKHPHYEEYLIARKPDGFTEDEWAFLRAATWADWVRSHHREQFDRPTWHYINYPIIPPGSKVDAGRLADAVHARELVRSLMGSVEHSTSRPPPRSSPVAIPPDRGGVFRFPSRALAPWRASRRRGGSGGDRGVPVRRIA